MHSQPVPLLTTNIWHPMVLPFLRLRTDQAVIFDSSNPTAGNDDLASDTLGGLLVISEDGNSDNPADNAAGGNIFFDFEDLVQI